MQQLTLRKFKDYEEIKNCPRCLNKIYAKFKTHLRKKKIFEVGIYCEKCGRVVIDNKFIMR